MTGNQDDQQEDGILWSPPFGDSSRTRNNSFPVLVRTARRGKGFAVMFDRTMFSWKMRTSRFTGATPLD